MLNDARLYQDVARGLESLLACIRMPEGRNTVFGSRDPSRQMTNAAVRDSSVGGCANAARRSNGRDAPGDRRCAPVPKGADARRLQDDPGRTVRDQVQTLKKLGRIPREGLTVAIDMHLIPGYGKKPGAGPTGSRYRKGTGCLGRYMTAQCVDDGIGTSLGAMHLRMPIPCLNRRASCRNRSGMPA